MVDVNMSSKIFGDGCLIIVRRVTEKPIRFLINNYSHFDHVYTNHLFSEATVISTHRGREETDANRKVKYKHDALFVRFLSDVDLRGDRYALQDVSFSGSLSFYQGSVKSACSSWAWDIPDPTW